MKKFLPTKQWTIDNGQLTKKKLSNGFTTFMKTERGFTLVELLVVVTIIAILSVIGITLLGNVQVKARDARRTADIDAIAKAMEVNYGKTAAGLYSLGPNDFNSKVVPTEIGANKPAYCLLYATVRTVDAVKTIPDAWEATDTCPGATSSTPIPLTPTMSEVTGMVWWRVCAVLEGGSVVCRLSSQ